MADTGISRADNSITPQIIKQEGAGKAYQSVAQSTAIAIQDAVDNLRNINTISATAQGVAMAQMLAQQNPAPWTTIIAEANTMSTTAIANFLTIGQNAALILQSFPTGA